MNNEKVNKLISLIENYTGKKVVFEDTNSSIKNRTGLNNLKIKNQVESINQLQTNVPYLIAMPQGNGTNELELIIFTAQDKGGFAAYNTPDDFWDLLGYTEETPEEEMYQGFHEYFTNQDLEDYIKSGHLFNVTSKLNEARGGYFKDDEAKYSEKIPNFRFTYKGLDCETPAFFEYNAHGTEASFDISSNGYDYEENAKDKSLEEMTPSQRLGYLVVEKGVIEEELVNALESTINDYREAYFNNMDEDRDPFGSRGLNPSDFL